MQLVIELAKEQYDALCMKGVVVLESQLPSFLKALRNGIVLPKGHGDLITKEQAIELVEFYQINPQNFDFVNLIDEIKNEKSIIPSDCYYNDGEVHAECVVCDKTESENMKKLYETIERFNHNAEYERTHGSLQGCLEFRQLAKWLKELKAYREMYRKEHMDDYLREESEDKE